MSYKKVYQTIKSLKNKELRGGSYFKNGVPCVLGALCKELRNPSFKLTPPQYEKGDYFLGQLPKDFQERFLKSTGMTSYEALDLQVYNDTCAKRPSHNRRYNMVLRWLSERV